MWVKEFHKPCSHYHKYIGGINKPFPVMGGLWHYPHYPFDQPPYLKIFWTIFWLETAKTPVVSWAGNGGVPKHGGFPGSKKCGRGRCIKHEISMWRNNSSLTKNIKIELAVCQNPCTLVNIKIAGKWMFIPLKMVLIGMDQFNKIKFRGMLKGWNMGDRQLKMEGFYAIEIWEFDQLKYADVTNWSTFFFRSRHVHLNSQWWGWNQPAGFGISTEPQMEFP